MALSLPISPRDIYKQRLEIKINCWQNIIEAGNMDWKERENAFEQLSIFIMKIMLLIMFLSTKITTILIIC